MRLIAQNVHDTGSLTATSAQMPVENTQLSERSKVWRSDDTAEQVIECLFAQTSHLTGFVIANHNLSAAATARLRLYLAEVLVYDSGDVDVATLIEAGVWRAGIDPYGATIDSFIKQRITVIWLPTTIVCNEYSLTLTDAANPDGYLEIGRIVTGLSVSPVCNPEYGATLAWRETAQQARTEAGTLRTKGTRATYREVTLNFAAMNGPDRQMMVRDLVLAGKSADLFVSLYPMSGNLDEIEHSFICRRQNDFEHTAQAYGRWSAPLVLSEA